MGFHLAIKLNTKYETLREMCEWILATVYSENSFARVFTERFWEFSRRSNYQFLAFTNGIQSLHLHCSRSSETHFRRGWKRTRLDWCWLISADANNNNPRGRLSGTGDREMCSRRNSVVFGRCILLFLLHILYQCIDNLILFNITLTCNVNKSIFRELERKVTPTTFSRI